MPIKAKGGEPTEKTPEAIPFEQALHQLESILDAMEAGDLPLESLVARYEEGVGLAKVCQAKLGEAELKIQKLEKNSAGEPVLQSLVQSQDDE